MSLPAGLLGGAQDRLLPASIPFRFFLSATVFHVLAWATLFLAADELAQFRSGPGRTLAAIHLATLGVFAMTAIGASYQLLPVVTRRPLARDWPARLSFWLMLPGICLVTYGMSVFDTSAMQTGAVLVCAGLAVFAVLTGDNLRRATSLPVVSAHGWLALVCLAGAAILGALLIWDFDTGQLDDHKTFALIHMVWASFGFMGGLVLAFSLILIPMLAMSRSLPHRPGWAQLALAALAVGGASAGFLVNAGVLSWIWLSAGIGATGCYLWLMRAALMSRMRKRLGLSFVLMRASWGMLVLGLILTGGLIGGASIPNLPVLTGFVFLAGWLLTFLLGVLQRILPFLASMHAIDGSGLPALTSTLTAEGPLRVHGVSHMIALVLCGAGIVLDRTILIQGGAGFGLVGAVAFAGFAVNVVMKMQSHA